MKMLTSNGFVQTLLLLIRLLFERLYHVVIFFHSFKLPLVQRVQKQREELHSLRAENQQLLLATQRLGPGAASGNANSVSNAGASSSGVTSQLRKLLRLCGRSVVSLGAYSFACVR